MDSSLSSSAVPVTSSSVSSTPAKPLFYPYVPASPVLTQKGESGVTFDFNHGIRVCLPSDIGKCRISFWDEDMDTLLYEAVQDPCTYASSLKKYFIRFRLRVVEEASGKVLVDHLYNAEDKPVMIQAAVGTLGDSVGWFSYFERFQQKHKCKLVVVMTEKFSDIFRKQYPDMIFVTPEQAEQWVSRVYATYYVGLYFGGDTTHQPHDFRQVGLHRTAGHILGLNELSDIPPRLDLSAPRKIQEPYICIAGQSTSQAKFWHYPTGWVEVIRFLKKIGYRVLCVDQSPITFNGQSFNQSPFGSEDFTGNLPLQERIDLIKDADAFIGLSSGLSWLAWACKVPVVMISGFTAPENEFYTPYRVFNKHSCHSCWNDMRTEFDHNDPFWCPRLKDTPRRFECTRAITPDYVIQTLKKIPAIHNTMQKKD